MSVKLLTDNQTSQSQPILSARIIKSGLQCKVKWSLDKNKDDPRNIKWSICQQIILSSPSFWHFSQSHPVTLRLIKYLKSSPTMKAFPYLTCYTAQTAALHKQINLGAQSCDCDHSYPVIRVHICGREGRCFHYSILELIKLVDCEWFAYWSNNNKCSGLLTVSTTIL